MGAGPGPVRWGQATTQSLHHRPAVVQAGMRQLAAAAELASSPGSTGDAARGAGAGLVGLHAAAVIAPVQQGVDHVVAAPLGGVSPVQALVAGHQAPDVKALVQHDGRGFQLPLPAPGTWSSKV